MAKRYIGEAVVTVTYHDSNDYRGSVKVPGASWRFLIRPAPSGFGPGIAYDSPEAYDSIAASAATFGSIHDRESNDPDRETAGAVEEAVGGWQDDKGRYAVARSRGGPVRWVS